MMAIFGRLIMVRDSYRCDRVRRYCDGCFPSDRVVRERIRRTSMRCLFAVVTLAIAAPVYAGVDPQIVDAIKKVKPSDYPSANVVTVISDQTVAYQPDGQFTNIAHVARLVLTTAGKAEVASTSLYYTKDAEKMEVLS